MTSRVPTSSFARSTSYWPFICSVQRALLLQPRLRARPLDLGLGLAQQRSLLGQRALAGGPVELRDDVALLHLGAVPRELHDLEIAGAGRRGDDDRAHGLDLAAQRQQVDELAAHDLRGLDVARPPSRPSPPAATRASRRRPARSRDQHGRAATSETNHSLRAMRHIHVHRRRQIRGELRIRCRRCRRAPRTCAPSARTGPATPIGETCSSRAG